MLRSELEWASDSIYMESSLTCQSNSNWEVSQRGCEWALFITTLTWEVGRCASPISRDQTKGNAKVTSRACLGNGSKIPNKIRNMIRCNVIERVTQETEQVQRLKQGHVAFYSEESQECSRMCSFQVRSQNCEKRLLASSLKSVRPVHTHGTTRLPLDEFLWKFKSEMFRKSVEKIQVSLKSDKSNRFFTWRRFHIYDNSTLNSS